MAGLLAGTALTLYGAPLLGQDDETATQLETRWLVLARPHVDLWYHGLATVGFEQAQGMPLYNAQYVNTVQGVKDSLGVRTKLDKDALEFLGEFQDDDVFQSLHFLPLYFPTTSPERLLGALAAVAERDLSDTSIVGPDTRTGLRWAAATFRSGDQRKVLGRFVEALDEEWEKFYEDYWEDRIGDTDREAELQRRWDQLIAPAVDGFLTSERLKNGRIFVSPALGPEGRLVRGNAFQGLDHAVGVWSPEPADTMTSLFSAIREMCFAVVNTGPAAVRCGAMLLEQNAPELVPGYQRVYVNAVGGDTSPAGLAGSFERSFPVAGRVVAQIEEETRPEVVVADEEPEEYEPPTTAWVVRPQAHVDLWYHSLAVIQADQPGPLGLYSADYARAIREEKQRRGIYPTELDVLADQFREDIGEGGELDLLHFMPLYFPRADPEELLQGLRVLAERDLRNPASVPASMRGGLMFLGQFFDRGGERRLLKSLVEAIEGEWNVFYRDYWTEGEEERDARYEEIQDLWDGMFAQKLAPYLENRRLSGGLIVPSPAIGPEGRIVETDNYNPQDQVVSVQLPLNTDNPDATVFAFIKELCFILVDERQLRPFAADSVDFEDLRRRAAVRCGAYIMEFHAPIMAARYRRVFLDAVGAEESSTVSAFERVYFLPKAVDEIVREQVRRR
jgi:hypothetical protein